MPVLTSCELVLDFNILLRRHTIHRRHAVPVRHPVPPPFPDDERRGGGMMADRASGKSMDAVACLFSNVERL
jgi:hypothetical protein